MSITKTICWIGLLGLSLNAFAQQEERLSKSEEELHELHITKKEKLADKLMKEGSYYSAVEYYKEIWEKDSSRYDIKYKIALSYYFSRDYKNAEPWFKKAVKLEPKAPTLALFYYGESLRHNEKYEEAKKQYTNFKSIRYRGTDASLKKKLNAQHIKACDFALQEIKSPVSVKVENLGDKVNSNYSDFSPWLISDSVLIYASLRSDTVLRAKAHTTDFYPVHLYKTTKVGDEWGEPQPLSRKFNKTFSHTANPVFSKDGKTKYFTHCKPNHNKIICHIYKSEWVDNEWTQPKKLHDKINNSKYTSTQPALGYVKKKIKREIVEVPVLYFVSDRTGTKGGLDIWYAEMKDNKHFKTPKNCGTRINTPGDEISPFYHHSENTMYFSSNYHLGYGGLDVFKSSGDTKSWKPAENIGYGLNSSLDDTYFSIDSTLKKGFFVSNRRGGHALTSETCCDDIFEYSLVPEKEFPLDGMVYDTTMDKPNPLIDANVSLYLINDNGEDSLINTVNTTKELHRYAFVVLPNREYYFMGSKDGYDSEHFNFNTSHIDDQDTLHIDYPMWPEIVQPKDSTPTEDKQEKETENIKEIYPPGFVLKNVLHDFDAATHSSGTGINIDDVIKIMKENPYMIISIESHTDSKGSDEYNLKLSERRASSAKTYLLRKGISGTRIQVKYFGEAKPIAPNTKSDGSDNPKGRALNRRTEFKVVSNKAF